MVIKCIIFFSCSSFFCYKSIEKIQYKYQSQNYLLSWSHTSKLAYIKYKQQKWKEAKFNTSTQNNEWLLVCETQFSGPIT
jgi:hypothetical protein